MPLSRRQFLATSSLPAVLPSEPSETPVDFRYAPPAGQTAIGCVRNSILRREVVLDSELLEQPAELMRILAHELFHFVWRRLDNRARRQWEEGNCFNGPGRVWVDLAEHLVEITPWADWTVFAKNGSDVTTAAVKLARAQVIAAYPITPQTSVVEQLSAWVESGEMDAEFVPVESEHSEFQRAVNRALDAHLRALDKAGGFRKPARNVLAEQRSLDTFRHPRWTRDLSPGDIVPALVMGTDGGVIRVRVGRLFGTIGRAGYAWTRRRAEDLVRLTLPHALPLRIGDRALLRRHLLWTRLVREIETETPRSIGAVALRAERAYAQ